MFLLLLLSILVVQVLNITLNEDYFVSYVKQYPVKSISPCEDFFAHACSAVPEEDLSSAFKRKQIEAMFNPEDYVNEKAAKLSVFLKQSSSINEDNSADVAYMEKRVRSYCFQNRKQCRKYATALKANALSVNVSLNYEGIIKTLTKSLQKVATWAPVLRQQCWQTFYLITLTNAFIRALEDPKNQEAKKKFDSSQLKIREAFDQVKEVYLRRIEASPWVHDRKLLEHYKTIEHVEFRNHIWNSVAQEYFDVFFPVFENCERSKFDWYKDELFLCAKLAIEVAEVKTNLPLFYQIGVTANAGYANSQVVIAPEFVPVMESNAISAFAVINFVVGHELGHHIFQPIVTNVPTLMPEAIQCLKEHRAHVCDTASPKCWSGYMTAGEDAPDVVALDIMTEMFKELKGGMEIDSSIDMSKEQFFFYSMTANWCTPSPTRSVLDVHSPHKERINSLLMHSKFFHETFECKKGDKMWQDPKNFCNLLGPESHRK